MEKIFHIPHSSTYIPKKYRDEFLLSDIELDNEISIMCDTKTNEMIDHDKIVFPYSRILCDVERFNSEEEIMNRVGMGVLYTKTHDLKTLRVTPSKDIISLYDKHHKELNVLCKKKLETNDEILFIDLHSFSNDALPYELNKEQKRPNICLGINERYNKKIIKKIITIVENFNYTYSINEPFSGCLLPSEYMYDDRVHGVMIEINKLIYNDEIKFKKIRDFLKCIEKEI